MKQTFHIRLLPFLLLGSAGMQFSLGYIAPCNVRKSTLYMTSSGRGLPLPKRNTPQLQPVGNVRPVSQAVGSKVSLSIVKPLALGGILASMGWLLNIDFVPTFLPRESYVSGRSSLKLLLATINGFLLDIRIRIASYITAMTILISKAAKNILPVGTDPRVLYFSVPAVIGFISVIYSKLVAHVVFAPVRVPTKSSRAAMLNPQWTLKVNSKTIKDNKRLNAMISQAARERQDQAKSVVKFFQNVKKPDFSSTILTKMVDVKSVFSRIDSEVLAEMITPNLFPVVDKVLKDDVFFVKVAKRLPMVPTVYSAVLQTRTEVVVRKVIDRIKADPNQFLNFKSIVAGELSMHQNMVDSLSKRCEMFILLGGLWSGAMIGASQVLAWLTLDPFWAIGLISAGFVYPSFLVKKEEQVANDFSDMILSKLLTPENIWNELAFGVNSPVLVATIAQELQSEMSLLVYNTGKGSWREFANKIREALPAAAAPSYPYLEKALDVRGTLKHALSRTSAFVSQWYGI